MSDHNVIASGTFTVAMPCKSVARKVQRKRDAANTTHTCGCPVLAAPGGAVEEICADRALYWFTSGLPWARRFHMLSDFSATRCAPWTRPIYERRATTRRRHDSSGAGTRWSQQLRSASAGSAPQGRIHPNKHRLRCPSRYPDQLTDQPADHPFSRKKDLRRPFGRCTAVGVTMAGRLT
jgi:hypothetical protein